MTRSATTMGPRILRAAGLAVAALSPALLRAQNCALCYQSVAASPNNFIQALKGGIFVLILPSFLICAGVTIVAYRRRDTVVQNDSTAGE